MDADPARHDISCKDEALFSQILTEMNNYRTGSPKRCELLKQISDLTGNNVISYVANLDARGSAASIGRDDPIPLFDLFQSFDKQKGIDLILNSYGGDPDAAEKIMKLCRGWGKQFRVIVPYVAKSAATLIALGSDQIIMGKVSEIGPIDPQMRFITRSGQVRSSPANSYLDSIAAIEKAISDNGGKIPPIYIPFLRDEFEPSFVDSCQKAIEKSKKTARDWLARYMLRGDPQKAADIADKLCDAGREYLSHGTVIDAPEAITLGLNVLVLDQGDPLWKKIWEYYCRTAIMFTQNSHIAKVFEGQSSSIQRGLKVD